MDKAPAYGAGDSQFESVQWYLLRVEPDLLDRYLFASLSYILVWFGLVW